MIDKFTREDFENALPINSISGEKLWSEQGLVGGEYTYSIAVDDDVSIEVRSSVQESGVSADSGQDSIRT